MRVLFSIWDVNLDFLSAIYKGKSKIKLLNPKLLLSFNDQENDILGDYFIGTEELNWGNIFSGKKIRSLTKVKLDCRFHLGWGDKFSGEWPSLKFRLQPQNS